MDFLIKLALVWYLVPLFIFAGCLSLIALVWVTVSIQAAYQTAKNKAIKFGGRNRR